MKRQAWAVAALAAALALPTAAQAAPDAEVGIEDEGVLLHDNPEAAAAVDRWRELGVDVVRIHARWQVLAPGRHATRRPAGFRAADPADRRYTWGELDRAVALVRSRGMAPMLTVTGPGPLWASGRPGRRNPRYKPKPAEFANFARAVATRYGAQVNRYLIWNEPNQGGWLEPQWECPRKGSRRGCVIAAPHLYRALVRAAGPAIKRADPGAQILIGELAPIGSPNRSSPSPIAPLPFLRALGCVDAAYKPLRTGYCRGFRPAAGDALGYHPHGVQNAPDRANRDRDEAQIADLPRLLAVLDRLTRAGRIAAPRRRLDLYLTEFAYQTSPPDHAVGVTLAQQTRYLQQSAYIAWRNPRVRNLTQYQWLDEPVLERGVGKKAYARWQSGLLFVTGAAKPVLSVFPQPFVVDIAPGARTGRLWGQARPGGAHPVRIQRRAAGATDWETIAEASTDAHGYWSRVMPVTPGAEYRFGWGLDTDFFYGGPERRVSGAVRIARASGGTRLHAAAAVVSR